MDGLKRQMKLYFAIFQSVVFMGFLYPCHDAWAAIAAPKIFSDNMVIQRGVPVPVWGWAAPGESVTLAELSEGTHYLLGFFEDESLEELPVRLIALQADDTMGTRHYDVYSVPELMMAVRGQGMLARFAGSGEVAVAEEQAAETVEELGDLALAWQGSGIGDQRRHAKGEPAGFGNVAEHAGIANGPQLGQAG